MTTITEKTCPGCGLCKAADQFNANKSRADGLQRFCRACQKDLKADWQARNLEKTRAYDRNRRSGKTAPDTPSPALASPLSGEGGENEEETKTAPAAQPPAAAAAKDAQPAFGGEREDHERLAAQPATPTVDATTNTAGFADLPHAAIVRSKTNPRNHFDEAFLADLAVSIRANGVIQPILVRPLPSSRIEETSHEPPRPTDAWPFSQRPKRAVRATHEIVAGEQRWRAAGMAGLRTVPAMIRELTDAQVLEIQLVENLKRRDLHPMEEAEGYDRLRETVGLSTDDIADRIGKGRSYVYKTMNLLKLVPDARKAFYDGKLTRSTAELVAMRPPGLQLQVLKDITATDFHGEPMSYRKAKDHIDSNYMLKLGSAVFKITDETLVPDAGSCRTCPKRSGANPQLFDDVAHADTCTDPPCFNLKKQAHYDRIRAEAEARGQTVITGKEAREIMPNSNTLRGYTKVDDHEALGGKMRTLRKVLGDNLPPTTLIEDPTSHEMVAVLPTAAVSKLLKDHGITSSAPQAAAKQDEATAKRQSAEKLEKNWREQAIEKLHKAACDPASGEGISGPVVRQLAMLALDSLIGDQLKHAAAVLDLGKVAPRDALENHIKTVDESDIEAVLFLLLAERDMRQLLDHAGKPAAAPHIEALAADLSVDLDGIRAAAKKAMRDEVSSKRVDDAAKAAGVAAKPAAGKPVKPPKVTQEQAASAIAEQLKAADNPNAFQAGQRVRLKTDLRKGNDVIHTRGVEAEVLRPVGDRAWMVQPDSVSFTLSADYTEMEAIEP